ncbi:unnamed protein product, partial [Brassica oleracea]
GLQLDLNHIAQPIIYLHIVPTHNYNEQLNLTVLTRGYGSLIRVKGDVSPVDHRSRLMIMVWINDGLGEINAMNVTARNESVMAGASPPLRFPKAWILHIEQEGNEKPIWRREEIIGEVEKKRKWLMRLPRRKKVFIDDIKPWNNSYKLKVQVMKLWKLWRSKKIVSIEMVLEDATGTRIHASIDEDLIQIYEGKVSEGVAFFISNFTLVNYATEYRTNPFPYKLPFYRTTNITPCDDFPSCLPNKYLKNFSEIHYGILKNDVLIG